MTMQQTLYAGDALNFPTSTPGYPADQGWVLKWRLVPATVDGPAIELTSAADTVDPTAHRTQAAAATTADWLPALYGWVSWVEKGSDVYTISTGEITVAPNPRTLAAGFATPATLPSDITLDQAREQLALWLAASEAITKNQSYKIGDRELTRVNAQQVTGQIDYWRGQINRLTAKAAGRRSGPLGRITLGVPR